MNTMVQVTLAVTIEGVGQADQTVTVPEYVARQWMAVGKAREAGQPKTETPARPAGKKED